MLEIYKIEDFENSKILVYNDIVLKIPKSYHFLSNSTLAITKKDSKITRNYEQSNINYTFNNIENYACVPLAIYIHAFKWKKKMVEADTVKKTNSSKLRARETS